MILLPADREEELVEGLRNRNDAVMRDFYLTYYRYLAATAMLYVSDQQDLQDLMQDVFIKIFTRINRFSYRGHGSLQAWIHKIAVNESLRFLQAKKKQSHYPIERFDRQEEDEEDIPLVLSIDDIPQDDLLEIIRSLPDRYRMVFNLFVFENKSHKEIGALLKIKEDTSASNLHRARALLNKWIIRYREERKHGK